MCTGVAIIMAAIITTVDQPTEEALQDDQDIAVDAEWGANFR